MRWKRQRERPTVSALEKVPLLLSFREKVWGALSRQKQPEEAMKVRTKLKAGQGLMIDPDG
jgi:hypothetical protein